MRLTRDFYCRDVLEVAPGLLGKKLVRRSDIAHQVFVITEVEAYRGEEDGACHARFGKTGRNRVMYETGGLVYVYLVYGMHWMFNIVTGPAGHPQAVLVRGLEGLKGPGLISRELQIDRQLYGEDLVESDKVWIEDGQNETLIRNTPRIGIDYAPEPWKSMPWRYLLDGNK